MPQGVGLGPETAELTASRPSERGPCITARCSTGDVYPCLPAVRAQCLGYRLATPAARAVPASTTRAGPTPLRAKAARY